MQVRVSAAVFLEEDSVPKVLAIINTFLQGRHTWIVDDPELLDQIESYLAQNVPTVTAYSDLAKKGLVAAVWSTQKVSVNDAIVVTPTNLADAEADLQQPSRIVVENLDSDRYFLEIVSHAYGATDIVSALECGHLEIEHGGGETTERVAITKSLKYPVSARIVVLLDSDRMHPTHITTSHAKAERLTGLRIKVWVSELREAENYMPGRAIASACSNRIHGRRITALKNLTSDQRGYYDMKLGFGSNTRPQIRAEQAKLYENLPPNDIQTLRVMRNPW